jgi:hypothetical protein
LVDNDFGQLVVMRGINPDAVFTPLLGSVYNSTRRTGDDFSLISHRQRVRLAKDRVDPLFAGIEITP